jgi:hypothetical protein
VGLSRRFQRDFSASMSACMRSLCSSDQRAPGLSFALGISGAAERVRVSGADLLAPVFSLRVRVGFEDAVELSMRQSISGVGFLDGGFSVVCAPGGVARFGYPFCCAGNPSTYRHDTLWSIPASMYRWRRVMSKALCWRPRDVITVPEGPSV